MCVYTRAQCCACPYRLIHPKTSLRAARNLVQQKILHLVQFYHLSGINAELHLYQLRPLCFSLIVCNKRNLT